MYFPQDVWNEIRGYLLLEMDGRLAKKICEFQEKIGNSSFALRCHLYYRVLRTNRDDIVCKMISSYSSATQLLSSISIRTLASDAYFASPGYDVEESHYIWEMFLQDREKSMKCIKAIRVADRFFDIYETISTKQMLEIMEEISEFNVSYQYHIEDYIDREFYRRRKVRNFIFI